MKFQQVQHEFVAYLRDPTGSIKPGDVAQERLDVYRELLFNNVSGFVSAAFPVLKSLYTEQAWQQRLQLFFAEYRCENPLFLSIAHSFLDFLQHQYQLQREDPVFMLELAQKPALCPILFLTKFIWALQLANCFSRILSHWMKL